MNFVRRLYRPAWLCLWRPGKRWLEGFACVAVEVGLPERCVAEVEEIVLGECFDAFRRVLTD